MPVYYPAKNDSIEVSSMADDLCSQGRVYLIKLPDSNGDSSQQKARIVSSLGNPVYDDDGAGGRGGFHTVTPTLIRLPGSTETTGLLLCHRLNDDSSSLSKTQSENDFAAIRRPP